MKKRSEDNRSNQRDFEDHRSSRNADHSYHQRNQRDSYHPSPHSGQQYTRNNMNYENRTPKPLTTPMSMDTILQQTISMMEENNKRVLESNRKVMVEHLKRLSSNG